MRPPAALTLGALALGALALGALALGALALSSPASAQDDDGRVGADADGFTLTSADGRFGLDISPFLQGDARFFPGDDEELGVDQFVVRRARLDVEATHGAFSLVLQPDFGLGELAFEVLYVEAEVESGAGFRLGLFKVPVGLENLRSSSALTFAERGLPSALLPAREVGIQGLGSFLGDRIEAAVALTNGAPNGAVTHEDRSDAKDVSARLFVRPFGGALASVGFGVGASTGVERGEPGDAALASYRTPGRRTFARYQGNAFADGERTRISPQAFVPVGPFSVLAEYVVSRERVALDDSPASEVLSHRAWQVAAAVTLTGERQTFGRIRPRRPVSAGGLGAFEAAVRVHALDLDADAFPAFFDPAATPTGAAALGVALSWYPTANARVVADVEHTSFDDLEGGEEPPAETVVVFRGQIAF